MKRRDCLEREVQKMRHSRMRPLLHAMLLYSEATLLPQSTPVSSEDKESVCNAGDMGLIPGSGRYPGECNGYTLQYFCLENSMDRGAWQVTVYGFAKSQTTIERLICDYISPQSYKLNIKFLLEVSTQSSSYLSLYKSLKTV